MNPSSSHGAPGDSRAAGPEAVDYKYWGFISYSHSDDEWAKWLLRALETYKVPRQLRGRPSRFGPLPRRLFPVFRDRDELPSASDLGAKLQDSLHRSRFLIIICSARSAVSRWVNEEVTTFKEWKRDGQILALIVDGEPNASDNPHGGQLECFPPALRFRVAEDRALTDERVEIIAADARPHGDGRSDALLKLLAGMLEVPFDELKQRERTRLLWARMRLGALGVSALLVACLTWLSIADAGLNLPGGRTIRRTLDRHELSVFRAVPSETKIRSKAATLRRELLAALLEGQMPGGWMNATLKPGEKVDRDVWTQGQCASSGLQMTDTTREERLKFTLMLRGPFEPGQPIEDGGDKLGWVSHAGDVDPIAETSLWMAAGLASALRDPDLLSPAEALLARQRLDYVQEALKSYRPDDSGGWNMFPRQKDPELHSVYSSTLALLALLETKRAGLPWDGSPETRDALLAATARWLCDRYNAGGRVPGWQASMTVYSISDGLTLQIYSLLMRAEAEAGFVIPPVIFEQILRHLIGCANRNLEFPDDQGEFTVPYNGIDGRDMVGKEAIGYLWHPWAIGACQLWLDSGSRHETRPEDRVRVRRTLAHLVIGLGDSAVTSARVDWTFIPSEMLFNLSLIKP